MPSQFTLVCPSEANLDKAIFAIEEEMGDNYKEIADQIDGLVLPTEDMDAALNVLNQLVSLGGDTLDNLSDRTGMPKNEPTKLEDETRFGLTGLALINGIPWKMDDSGNIEAVRKLYFALGSDKNKLVEILERPSNDFVFVNSKQNLITLPLKKNGMSYSLEEIRGILKNNSIQNSDILQQDDKIVVRTYSFISTDVSIKSASKLAGLPEDEIVSTVFHMEEIQNNSKTVNRYNAYGITGLKQQAALFGEDLEVYGKSDIESLVISGQQKLNRVMRLTGFTIQRYKSLTPQALNQTVSDVLVALKDASADINAAESMVNFKVTLIPDKSVYKNLTTKNSKDDFFYLLESRPDVTGIDFSITEEAMQTLINNSMAIRAGTTTLSAIKVNQFNTQSQTANNIYQIESSIDCVNRNLTGSTTLPKLQKAYGCSEAAQLISPYTPLPELPATPYAGQTCYDSPSSIASRQLNFSATYDTDSKIKKLMDMVGISALSKALIFMIQGIIRIANAARLKADQLVAKMRAKIAPWQAKFEALQSKYGSLVGQGSFDSSLLKCAIGFDVATGSDLFKILEELLRRLQVLINNIINAIIEIISKLLEKILCYPIVLIDNLLNKVGENLPTFCKVTGAALPSDLEEALLALRRSLTGYGAVFDPLEANLLFVKASVTNNVSKLGDFRKSMVCATNATNSFFNTALFSTGFTIPAMMPKMPALPTSLGAGLPTPPIGSGLPTPSLPKFLMA